MEDPLKRFIDECGVCREEALFYYEGFSWDLEAALKGCRSKTLPLQSVRVRSSPVNVNYGPVNDALRGLNPPVEQAPVSRDQIISFFLEAAPQLTAEDAGRRLAHANWDMELAFRELSGPNPNPNPQGFSRAYGPTIGRSNSQDHHSMIGQRSRPTTLQPRPSTAGRSDLSRGFPLASQLQAYLTKTGNSSSSSSAMDVDPTIPEPIPVAIPPMASSQVKESPALTKEEMEKCIGRICDALGVSREDALFYLEAYKWNSDAAMEGCRSKTLPPVEETSSSLLPSSPEQPSQLNDKLVYAICQIGGVTREEAIDCLKNFDWNYKDAMAYFLNEGNRRISNQPPNSPEQPSHQSNNERIADFCEVAVEASPKDAMDCLNRCGWDVNTAVNYFYDQRSKFQALHGSRNQGYLREGEIGSSSSSINADPTETGNVTVAIPGIASSQVVDEKLEGNAVDEDLSTEMVSVPVAVEDRMIVGPRAAATSITFTITLNDGGSGETVEISVRSDETVRDIHNRIEELRPHNNRDYYLTSNTEEYRDLNVTVQRIASRGDTTLLQVFPGP